MLDLRPATRADLTALTDIYNHYVRETAITFDVMPFTVERRETWFAKFADSGRYRLLVAVDHGAVIGYASSSPFRDKAAYETSVETTIYLHPESTGRGYGSALYGALFDVLAGEDLHRAYAGVALPNDGSVRLHKRCGFHEIGVYREVGRKFGRYWDVLWFERSLDR